jgi:ABC-type amino acid transport substrate-binding protein
MRLRLLFPLLVLAVPLWSQSVHLVVPEIEGLLTADGTGAYQKVLAQAATRAHVLYSLDVFPRSRALSLFLDGKYDGIFTYTQTARTKLGHDAVVASYPVGAYRGYAFRLKGAPPIVDFADLTGKRVGGVVGFEGTYDAVVHQGARLELVADDAANLAKLKAGRIDAMLAFLPDLFPQLAELSYAPAAPFFESYDRLTMRNTPTNRVWLEKLSTELQKMHADGSIRAIVGPSYLPVAGNFTLDD